MLKPSNIRGAWREASTNIHNAALDAAERGEVSAITQPNVYDRSISLPAKLMATGDTVARGNMQGAAQSTGMSPGDAEDFARKASLTGDVEWQWLKKLADAAKSSTVLGFGMPFSSTPARVVSEGADRIPGVGMITDLARQVQKRDSKGLQRLLAEQGMGAGIGAAAYQGGQELEDFADKYGGRGKAQNLWMLGLLRGGLTNVAGRYSLPASMGLAAGIASNERKDWLSQLDETVPAGVGHGLSEIPLLNLEAPASMFNAVKEGITDTPESMEELLEIAPSGVMPSILKDYLKKSIPGMSRR